VLVTGLLSRGQVRILASVALTTWAFWRATTHHEESERESVTLRQVHERHVVSGRGQVADDEAVLRCSSWQDQSACRINRRISAGSWSKPDVDSTREVGCWAPAAISALWWRASRCAWQSRRAAPRRAI